MLLEGNVHVQDNYTRIWESGSPDENWVACTCNSLYCLACDAVLSTQQLMEVGKKEIAATDDALTRAQRIVADTIEV
jgi:hypothetical protein